MNEDNRFPPRTAQSSVCAASYEITIQEHLDEEWSEWFGGMAFTRDADNQTVLTGPVFDQPALLGLLLKLNDLGLHLESVRRIENKSEKPQRR